MPKVRHKVDAARLKRVAVSAFDVGEDNTAVCAMAATTKPEGGIQIEPINLDRYPLGKDASERSDELVRKFRVEQQFLGEMNIIGVEQQVPVTIPKWKRQGMDPAQSAALDRAYAGNIKAYGIACNAIGALKMAYPTVDVRSVSPEFKWKGLGIHKPRGSKSRRKTRARAFCHSWLKAHAHLPQWRTFVRKFIDEEKGDDLADAFCTCLALLFDVLCQSIDARKIRAKK